MLTDNVSVLYVDRRGPYPGLVRDWWDAERDARLYAGPNPIVAHPPCGPWGRLKCFYKGGEHVLALIAVDQVRRWGGVLEHPAHSDLWPAAGLPPPGAGPDAHGGWTIEVCQVDWGHVARKRTWLYLVRVDPEALEWPASREPTHWVRGTRAAGKGKGMQGSPAPAHIKLCSAQQRRRTPIEFARYLLRLAASVAPHHQPPGQIPLFNVLLDPPARTP